MVARSGELAMRPLPAVLLDLHEQLATGRLVLKRGRVSKTVDLVSGNPVSMSSSPRDETLGHFLVAGGVISEDQHRAAVAHAARAGVKLGEALVALRSLTIAQLIDQLGMQARHKLVQALRWPQGAWRFDAGVEPEDGVQLRMIEVVLDGLRETAVEDIDRLARLDGMAFELTDRGQRLEAELRQVFGDAAIAAIADGAPIGEIERIFGDRAQARIAVDALLMCDAIAAQLADVGLGAEEPAAADRPSLARAPTRPPAAGSELFDILFDDLGFGEVTAGNGGAVPIQLEDADDADSGVVSTADVEAASLRSDDAAAARQLLTAEHHRVQNIDHYAVLMVGRRARAGEIEVAFAVRSALLDRDSPVIRDPRDRAKLDELRRVYQAARDTLLDERARAGYDRELAGGELVPAPPGIDAEFSFRIAEEMMARGQWEQAAGQIKAVIARSPGEADYHAALGWAAWMAGGESIEAADEARPHLNQALAINPDHPAAHDYKGRINAALGNDDAEALFHLERAIDLDPLRGEAVAAIAELLIERGELRRYEKVLKRLLFRLRGRGSAEEVRAWIRLAELYFDHLDDAKAGALAVASARRISPQDGDVLRLAQRVAGRPRRDTLEPIRAEWRNAIGDPQSGAVLVKSAEASGHIDAAFLAASTMVALGTADPHMAALYDQQRVRGAAVPARGLGRDHWAMLRHKDDGVELGALMELVAPAVHALAPMTLADSELDAETLVDDADMPAPFARMRQLCAELLGVPAAPVYSRVELGTQIHVVAADPPVLIAGDDALTAPERPELVYRLARAMTFLWPGRAVGGSRPGRLLRAVVLAVFREASGSAIGLEDPLAGRAADAVSTLPASNRVQARAAALRLLSRGDGLNLSLWARSLSRTADRAGMLLCGDVPAAFAGAREIGELDRDLVEFAYSAAHVKLRAQLGLSQH
ncbi:MAG: tetratricopeptide repeat protein [Deltaproteobacteria bacterium]|nr:MAG: tetratricopeptide repeat protein [Deltaproteobacteria bacterium]